jgi:hypothetical protein
MGRGARSSGKGKKEKGSVKNPGTREKRNPPTGGQRAFEPFAARRSRVLRCLPALWPLRGHRQAGHGGIDLNEFCFPCGESAKIN